MLVILCAASTIPVGGAELLSAHHETEQPTPLPYPAPSFVSEAPAAKIIQATVDERVSTYNNLAIQDALMGYHTRARAYFNKALTHDAANALAQCGLLIIEELNHEEKSKRIRSLKSILENPDLRLTPAEVFYVENFLLLANGDIHGAAQAFLKRAERYKADIMSGCWAAILLHYCEQAYDDTGTVSENQQRALAIVERMLNRYPSHPLILYTRAAIEENAPHVSDAALSAAEKSAQLLSQHPLARQLYGHLLYKSSSATRATSHLSAARRLFEQDRQNLDNLVDDDFELAAAELYEITAQIVSCGKIKQNQFPQELHGEKRGLVLRQWEQRSLPLRALLLRPVTPSAEEIKRTSQYAYKNKEDADVSMLDFYDCLTATLQVKYLVKEGRIKTAHTCMQKAEEAYQRLLVPHGTYKQQSATYKICFKRAIDCAHLALNIARLSLYPESANIWQQNINRSVQEQPHLLPPMVPTYSTSPKD